MFLFLLQLGYVIVSWSVCVWTVYSVGVLAGQSAALAKKTWKTLAVSRSRGWWEQVARALGTRGLGRWFEAGSEDNDDELLEDELWRVIDRAGAPALLLRGLAMCSGSLGLLATIVRVAAAEPSQVLDAMSSAVLGLVGALPCWTALAVSVAGKREVRSNLLREVRAESPPQSAAVLDAVKVDR